MTAAASVDPPATAEPWITNDALAAATGIDFTIVSRLRRQVFNELSSANARAVATGLSWPVGAQYEAWLGGTYGRDLVRAADRVGVPHAERQGSSPGCSCTKCAASRS